MWNHKLAGVSCPMVSQAVGEDTGGELSSAWKSLSQTKAALRHIENRLEAAPGTTVALDSLMDLKKAPSSRSRKVSRRDGRMADPALSKPAAHSRRSPEKSSRSPLRATTLDSNVRRPNCVEFREPLASYREPTSPLLTPSQLEAQTLLSELPSLCSHDAQLSRLVYLRDTRDEQTRHSESILSSALDSTVVRYLNDRFALDALRQPRWEGPPEAPQSSSPGSASRRLECLRRRQPDDKLEKLKERIRRQREHLEEAVAVEARMGGLERPLLVANGLESTLAVPTAKVRKVAAAPPAPVYKGFNPSEMRVRTSDGRVWQEEELRKASGEIHREVPLQLSESREINPKPTGTEKDGPSAKPVRKTHKADSNPAASVINTASWREGQKLVKMILGPAPRVPRQCGPETTNFRESRGHPPRAKSDPRPESNRRQRASSTEQNQGQPKADRASGGLEERTQRAAAGDVLPADIRGLLDDLQLETAEQVPATASKQGAKARARSAPGAPGRRARSNSPARAEAAAPKRRHYDAEVVRRYIARQQEERRKRQQEEKRAAREEAECRSRRLHELYQRQRGGASRAPEAPVHRRLRETFTELLREQAGPESSGLQPPYQPSGESDKENKRLDRPQSASSSSDLSLSDPQAPPLSREDLGVGVAWMQQDGMRAAHKGVGGGSLSPPTGPTGHLLSQLLGLEASISGLKRNNQHATLTDGLTKSKQSRIEALKATAASLSTRIETEARKLALAGAAYGSGKDADVGPPAQTDERWAKPVSPPVRDGGEPPLGAGHDVPDGALPGVGNLQDFLNRGEKVGESSRPLAGTHWQVPGTGQPPSPHASSNGSISEGPLLSEGSLSEGHGSEGSPRAASHLAESLVFRDFCAAEMDAIETLGHLRRETQKQHSCHSQSEGTEGRGPWEELAHGSPHSVINIFTKQLWGHSKAFEEKVERTSSPSLPTASAGYEDDFVSGPCSGSSSRSEKRANSGLSSINGIHSPHDEPLSRRSPFDIRTPGSQSHRSLGSTPLSSPCSAASVHKRESALEQTLVEKQKQSSDPSENHSSRGSPRRGSAPGVGHSVDSDGTLRSFSGLSPLSSASDSTGSPRSPAPSSSASPQKTTPDDIASAQIDGRKASSPQPPTTGWPSAPSTRPGAGGGVQPGVTAAPPSEPQYPPAALQQRMSAELNYLEAMEESVRQLAAAERLRAVGLAQQEGVSLAHILKTQQQRHEQELLRLKLKAEQEELESRRQLEETRQRAARAHTELQENMTRSQQVSLEGLQDSARRMMGQQVDAARHTAEASRHIREMTELARLQIAQALNVPSTPSASLPGQQREQRQQHPAASKSPPPRPASDRRRESSPERRQMEDTVLSFNSPLESFASGTPGLSMGSSTQVSPSLASCDKLAIVNPAREEKSSTSVEEEAHTAADDSLCSNSAPSLLDEKADTTSVATEYSLKFDESMTEDDIEERSFRSLLPSESHRRVTMERKRGSHEESEEEANREKSRELDTSKDGVKPFSSGQNSFSRFTMDMVRQYMTEEEVRAQHQSSLLRLREKALKDKTRAELAWLEHQKRRLRDKGEDDMMPPLRKRQRGLLLKLQQEQAEIKRLQEANRAARRERQLLLKQQEEIERMRHSTMRLRERLKSAGEASEDAAVSETADEAAVPSLSVTDLDTRSPSPVSVSGSETSSIMQKLKKMRCHMDEKHCSPVHYFFSVFTAHHWASLSVCFPNLHPKFQQFIYSQLVRFLTKREQQLMRRRRHAEELLQWKQRLDAEEAEVRSMEQRALAAWGGERPHRVGSSGAPTSSFDGRTLKGQDGDQSPAVTVSSQPTETSVHEELDSPSAAHPESEVSSPPKDLSQGETSIYSEDFDSESKLSPPSKTGTTRHTENSSRGKTHHHSGSWTDRPASSESRSAPQSEPTSDQSDIESRVRALKEELRKRKSIVYQLKKEQKKRHKERLKAQEASLLKQLECYNDFIQKTKADLSKDLEATPTAKPQIKAPTSATEKPRIKPPHMQRPETRKNWNIVKESEKEKKDDFTQFDHSKFAPIPKEISPDEGPPALTPTPVLGSPEHLSSLKDHVSSELLSMSVQAARLLPMDSGEESVVSIVSSQRSEVEEDLEQLNSDESAGRSFHSLKLDQEISPTDQQQDSLKEDHSVKCSEHEKSLHINDEIKGRETLEDKDLMSSSWQPNRSVSAAKESKDQQLPEKETSNKEDLYTSHHLSPVQEDLSTTAEVCVDSYHDDFESSVESSPLEGFKPSSPADPEKCPYSKSPTFSSEEEISEELLAKLNSASETSHSEKLLCLQAQVEHFIEIVPEVKDGTRSPELFPPSSPPPSKTVDAMPDFNIGDRVLVSNVQPGTLRFKGSTSFAKGFWAGVELDKSEGSNNGTYDGVVYFECEEGHGIFAPPDKVSLLSEKFEVSYVDTTEDEDSSFDDQFDDKSKKKHTEVEDLSKLRTSQVTKEPRESGHSGDGAPPDCSEALVECLKKQDMSDKDLILQSGKFELSDLKLNTNKKINGTQHLTPNGTSRNIILELEDATTGDFDLLITEVGKQDIEKASTPLLDLLTKEKETLEAQQNEKFDAEKRFDKQNVSSLTDKLLNNFVSDAIRQFQKIRNDKNEKILAASQLKGNDKGRRDLKELSPNHVTTCNAQLENLPSFIEDGQEEISSPELCARPESPVLGTSGKEELAKRLAVLELNRELLDDFGEEQDWFDEDFGLSSRKEQQKRQRQEPAPPGLMGLEGTEQAKVLAKSEPPQQAKLQEEPAMVVPHSAPEVEQLVSAATQVIWSSCDLGRGLQSLVGIAPPHAPEDYLGCSNQEQDMLHLGKRSYRQTVFDLTWEIIQEIFSENIDVHPPQWAKPRRLNSLYFRRVKCPADMAEVQAFVTAEVLKLLGLMKDQNQKTDWQKMLKFGRKKRDRVDHILVQELHEEESQWVNYDKDELFVKMQLADGIFDTLLKDTVDVFIQIQEKRAKTSLS
ncbi:centrosome-associated protein 350 isoform X4 [Brienomyrus brachyistius]|uniref:centrosome-associated protein 350 isoform X4 n=1 Tax=Brienomyrus brachyistius TaxID=42636 RepID=UPI0020B1884A|nr:centrosome-associated protein 350 isoform X4 [Brienomyrus brachyistius]